LIARTLATAAQGASRLGAPILVRHGPAGTLRISAIALSRSAPGICLATSRRAAAIVFIRNTCEDTRSLSGLLTAVYGLTPTEVRLSLMLSQGHTLRAAAEANEVSIETIRTQLKFIFQKTGTHRQAALIQLMSELAKTQ
jgi:DNA-binding CsgD family transcriptional regulator